MSSSLDSSVSSTDDIHPASSSASSSLNSSISMVNNSIEQNSSFTSASDTPISIAPIAETTSTESIDNISTTTVLSANNVMTMQHSQSNNNRKKNSISSIASSPIDIISPVTTSSCTRVENIVAETLETKKTSRPALEDGFLAVKADIRRQLAKRNPVGVINEFQIEHGLKVPETSNVMQFLDLLGIKRAHTYESVQLKLTRRLLEHKLDKLNAQQKQQLLAASFRYLGMRELQQVAVRLLDEMPQIPLSYLNELAAHPNILQHSTLPTNILRQVWAQQPHLFNAKLLPLLHEFVHDADRLVVYGSTYETNSRQIQAKVSPAERRKSDSILQSITHWIGSSTVLYDLVVHAIRDQFSSTQHHGYCVLRMELLMSLHDHEQQELAKSDFSHRFAWCLDAAVREGELDGRLLDELRLRFATLRQIDKDRDNERQEKKIAAKNKDENAANPTKLSQSKSIRVKAAVKSVPETGDDENRLERENRTSLQDLSMIVAHPLVSNIVLRSILHQIRACITREELPRNNESLRLLTHVLALGCSSRRLLRPRAKSKLPKSNSGVMRILYPLLSMLYCSVAPPLSSQSSNMISKDIASDVCKRIEPLFVHDKTGVCRCVLSLVVVDLIGAREWHRAAPLLRVIGSLHMPGYEPAPLSVIDVLATSLGIALKHDEAKRALINDTHSFGTSVLECCLVRLAQRSRVFYIELLRVLIALYPHRKVTSSHAHEVSNTTFISAPLSDLATAAAGVVCISAERIKRVLQLVRQSKRHRDIVQNMQHSAEYQRDSALQKRVNDLHELLPEAVFSTPLGSRDAEVMIDHGEPDASLNCSEQGEIIDSDNGQSGDDVASTSDIASTRSGAMQDTDADNKEVDEERKSSGSASVGAADDDDDDDDESTSDGTDSQSASSLAT